MSHVYFLFHLISKSFLSFLLIWSVCSAISNVLKKSYYFQSKWIFKKSNKNWEVCLVPIILQREKLFWTLLSTNELGQLEKRQQVFFGEKEVEAISAIRNTDFLDAENLGLLPMLDSLLERSQLRIRSLRTGTKCMSEHLTIEDKFVSQLRSKMLTSLPTSRLDSSLQKRLKQWNNLPMSTVFWTFFSKNCPKFSETLWLLRTVMYNKLF